MSSSYSINLSRDGFELIKAFCHEAKSGGHSRITELWPVLNAIFGVADLEDEEISLSIGKSF